MDGDEKKSGLKKRWKQTEVGLDSDDDEPIGSLLKLKKQRNPKKVKPGLERVFVRDKNVEVEGEDIGGMDDTLASFRKKLKGPKKDIASGAMKGRSSASVVVVESVDLSSTGTMEDGASDAKSVSKAKENGSLVGDGGSDMTMEIGIENKPKGKVKRPKIKSTAKTNDGGSESMGSGGSLLKDKNVSGMLLEEGTSHHSDDHGEDSLSSLFRRAQSGLMRKSRTTSSLKENNETSLSGESKRSNDREQSRPLKVTSEDPTCRSKVIYDEAMVDCSSTGQEELIVDPCCSTKVCDGDSKQCSSIQLVDSSLSPGQKSALRTCILKDGLRHNCTEDAMTVNSEILSSMVAKETSPPHCDGNMLNNGFQNNSKIDKLVSGENILVASRRLSCNSLPCHLKTSEALDCQNELDDECPKSSCDVQPLLSCNASDLQKKEEICTNYDAPNAYTEEPDTALGPRLKESAITCDFEISPIPTAFTGVHKCGSAVHQHLEEHKATCVHSQEFMSVGEETHGASPQSVAPDENESYLEDAVSLPDTEIKESRLSTAQRVGRKLKKRRHGDMAYEGDADWETLIDDQGFLDSQRSVDGDRTRVKFDRSSSIGTDAEGGGAAAVTAGLKARAVGPVEKIKFKEILKRRGGLQDYLECRLVLSIESRFKKVLSSGVQYEFFIAANLPYPFYFHDPVKLLLPSLFFFCYVLLTRNVLECFHFVDSGLC